MLSSPVAVIPPATGHAVAAAAAEVEADGLSLRWVMYGKIFI